MYDYTPSVSNTAEIETINKLTSKDLVPCMIILLRWQYTVNVPILMCSNNHAVLTYYILVNEINNEIHNLLQFTILLTKNTHLFEPKFALFYSKTNCAGPVKVVFEYRRSVASYTSSNMAVSRKLNSGFACNSFFTKRGTFCTISLVRT